MLQRQTGDYPAAAASQHESLDLFRRLGDRLGQAWALDELGLLQQQTGDHEAAAANLAQALQLHRELGSRHGESVALNSLGELSAATSAPGEARRYHSQALAIAREIGAPPQEARALAGIGRSLLADRPADAAGHLREALEIYQRIGSPDAQGIRDTLGEHGL
jgi:tetratricopeptide (TPR) repeat protein